MASERGRALDGAAAAVARRVRCRLPRPVEAFGFVSVERSHPGVKRPSGSREARSGVEIAGAYQPVRVEGSPGPLRLRGTEHVGANLWWSLNVHCSRGVKYRLKRSC